MEQQAMQQYLQSMSFPANKIQIVTTFQDSGAPEDMISHLQNNLPDGVYSEPQQVASKLSPGRASRTE